MFPGFKAEKSLGYAQVTNLAAAVAFPNIPAGTALVIVIPETQAVRWRDDGVDPTAAVGMPIAVGQPMQFTQGQLAAVKFIEQSASAKLNIAYYG